jgi:hypothetical protein
MGIKTTASFYGPIFKGGDYCLQKLEQVITALESLYVRSIHTSDRCFFILKKLFANF